MIVGACSDQIVSDHERDSFVLSHFLKRTGIHFAGKCSGVGATRRFVSRYRAGQKDFRKDPVGGWLFLSTSAGAKVERKKAYTPSLAYVADPKSPDIFNIGKGAFRGSGTDGVLE